MLGNTKVRGGVALLVAVTAMGACGGGSGSGLAKADVIKRGDAVCAATGEKVGPLFGKLFPNGDETPPASQAAPVMAQVSDAVAASYAKLQALEPKSADADAYGAFLDRWKAVAGAERSAAQLAKAGDTDGYLQKVQAGNSAFEAMGRAAKSFGFEKCGSA